MSTLFRALTARTAPWPQPPVTIERALSREIARCPAPLVVLEAPAGYGKSTLLMQGFNAATAAAAVAAWLSLDDHNEDGRTFLTSLVLAMAGLALELGPLHQQAARGFAGVSIAEALDQFVEIIRGLGRPISFFVDNLDNATDTVIPIIGALAQNLAPLCRFVVATRIHASAGLVTLKATGIAIVFNAGDLRFSREEGRILLQGHADSADADAIVDRVEGWPVMIRLVRLSMERRPDLFGVRDIHGHSGDLAEYLTEQILMALPVATQTILTRLAICERFNGDTLNALCDRTDGWNCISELVRKGLLLVPLDGQGAWHRFHPIFGEFLLERMKRKETHDSLDLHRRAAHWFASEGLLNDAIRHAKAAADIEFTLKLLARAGGWLIAFRGGTKTLRIIAALPDDVLDAHPYLRLGQIYLLAQESQLKDARAMFGRLTERAVAAQFQTEEEARLFHVSAGALDALLNIYEVRHVDPQRLLSLTQQCDASIPKQLAAMVNHLLGFAYYCDGNYIEARRVCTSAAEHCRAVDADFVAVYSYFALGDSHLEMAALEQAEHCFRLALGLASEFGSNSNQVSAAQIFLAEVAYERDEIELAASLLEQALPGIEHRDPWSSVYMSGHRVAAEILLRRTGHEAAIEFLERALGRLEGHELFEIYAPYLRVKMSEILARAGLIGAASWALRDESLRRENHEQQRQRSELLRVLASVRLTLIQGGGEVVLRQLDRLIPTLRGRNQRRRLIKVHTLKAVAYHQLNFFPEAERAIRAAVATAKSTGMLAPIIEETPLLMPLLDDSPAISRLLCQLRMGAERAPRLAAVPPDVELSNPGTSDGDRARLSRREQQILTLLADGLSGKEIAVTANIAVNTVLGYRKSLYRKLEASSRSAAIAAGRRMGYLQR